MSSSQTLKINCDRCGNAFVVIFFKTMYNKTIIRFGFCDIQNNQGLGTGKCYQPKPKASADNTYLDLDYSGYHKNLIQ